MSKSDRLRGALWSMFIADSLAMPTHWYYDGSQARYYGKITGYVAPNDYHPTSILHLSSTGGGGRGGQVGEIIGNVILHGKKKFWTRPNLHYHQGMKAGENTLNSLVARVLMRSINAKSGKYDPEEFLSQYVAFMTTPGTHNDTYAESYHRDFFVNYANGKPPRECAGEEGHNTASMGGFVMLPVVVLATATDGIQAVQKNVATHLYLTHKSPSLLRAAQVYATLLVDLLDGMDLKEAVVKASTSIGLDMEGLIRRNLPDTQVVGGVFSNACYISGSFPALLYMAYKFSDDYEGALLFNANVGGENCHRGAALGAVMGLAHGYQKIPSRFVNGLNDHDSLKKEIDSFVENITGHSNQPTR
eukprot:TRINITY_DN349_c0_g1_i3.p1 TRINITY_DN349_c0_g1~~TRINITY_DN349_c0_g1_i3.p1  ORF type:complete len:360 (-),score=80.94 TRINITY_DN349_c0_g1_i3:281-1360(-)